MAKVVIEFIHFKLEDSDATLYAALLLRPTWKHPKWITLCEEKDLAALFQEMGSDSLNIVENYQTNPASQKGERSSRLYDLLWKPLEKHLKNVKKIYYSPSGLLHQVSFAAIAPKPGTVLADRYDLEYVSSTRELALGRKPLNGDSLNLQDAAIFGGIRYEADTTSMEDYLVDCENGIKGDKPKFLCGSLAEMRAIHALLAAHGIACDTFSAYRASEAQVKIFSSNASQPSPSILHLSTHGYYLPDPKLAADTNAYDAPFKWADNPLFRSWLLMAGGMDAHTGKPKHLGSHDDGVLTAYEIAPLNLSNTKLVVLSACQTGLGDLRGSEGVYGLQRAFKMAGVEHLLVTLWQVDDQATAAFMKAFYSHWLSGSGMEIRAAFRQAQADIRSTKGWEGAYFWAGFVLI